VKEEPNNFLTACIGKASIFLSVLPHETPKMLKMNDKDQIDLLLHCSNMSSPTDNDGEEEQEEEEEEEEEEEQEEQEQANQEVITLCVLYIGVSRTAINIADRMLLCL
jgi:CO dehydrogenase/acetyl-CoA synthase beta subunit